MDKILIIRIRKKTDTLIFWLWRKRHNIYSSRLKLTRTTLHCTHITASCALSRTPKAVRKRCFLRSWERVRSLSLSVFCHWSSGTMQIYCWISYFPSLSSIMQDTQSAEHRECVWCSELRLCLHRLKNQAQEKHEFTHARLCSFEKHTHTHTHVVW